MGGASSATHFTRNNFIVRGLDLGANVTDIIGGSLPTPLVRDFIHEVTHHWCFTFSAGYAIAMLRLRAQFAMVGRHETWQDLIAAVTDEVVVRVARAALDPIAEGLALFAEFDLKPGARTTPPIFGWIPLLFLRSDIDRVRLMLGDKAGAEAAAAELDMAILHVLERERATRECQSVRENLLSQPFALEASGHYLLGYAFIRRMERRLRQAFGALAEPGLVLEWVARFIFDDAQLILLLFHEARLNSNQILVHLEARLELMVSDQALDWFTAFANDRAGRDASKREIGVRSTPAWLLGLKEDEVLAAAKVMKRAQTNLTQLPGVSKADGFDAVWSTIMRHVTALGQIHGETQVHPSGSIRFSSPRLTLLEQGLDGISPGSGPGVLTVFFSSVFSTHCSIVARGDEVVSIHCNGKSSSEEFRNYLISPLGYFPKSDNRLRELDAWYQAVLNDKFPDLHSSIFTQVRPEIERIYQSAALGEITPAKRAELVLRMRKEGFFGLLDVDLDRLKDLVALGLPGSEAVPPPRVAALAAAGESAGLPLVEILDGRPIARF